MKHLKIFTSMALLSVGLFSCGKKGLSGDVSFEPLPDVPLVINADFTLGSGDNQKVIEAPWYLFKYKFKNNSDQNLVIVTLTMKVSGVKNGAATSGDLSLDPGADCEDGFERRYLAYVKPGETFSGFAGAPGGGYGCITEGADYADHVTNPIDDTANGEYDDTYLYGLPESTDNIYSVQITAQGWFEKPVTREITERLVLTGFQTTR